MAILLTNARRGLYSIEEYLTYRGEFKNTSNELIPLSKEFEPIIYMKCLINSHQFPIRPETGEKVITYDNFKGRDFITTPFSCPTCGEKDIIFKYCELEDQPRTFNDPNHRFILNERRRVKHPLSRYYEKAEDMYGIARPDYEDYFEPGHTNHMDPFTDHIVTIHSGDDFFSENTRISQRLTEEEQLPLEDIYDSRGVYLIKRAGSDMPTFPEVDPERGKHTDIRKNYDFYRAIIYSVTQLNIT